MCTIIYHFSPPSSTDITSYQSLVQSIGDFVTELQWAKAQLGHLTESELHYARKRANPFELLGKKAGYLTRAAIKLACLDSVFALIPSSSTFKFADICGGPGKYILERNKSPLVQGFGVTLKGVDYNHNPFSPPPSANITTATIYGEKEGALDFQVEKFKFGGNRFMVYYGEDNSGDILSPQIQKGFVDLVLQNAGLVDLVMADGGFSVKGMEAKQEELHHELMLAQILIALQILAKGGNFICKMFELLEDSSQALIHVLLGCFDQLCICKPAASRPSNSERYVVARGFRTCPPNLREAHANSMAMLKKDVGFVREMNDCNELFLRNELEAIQLVLNMAQNPNWKCPFDQLAVMEDLLNRLKL